ncbi:hypothetical protein AC249_AIPGENE2896 [Exaiptasia diaphana]|nr:hypothetical protein AC249_AIPGENE2896 [Exaiptasia diaphana]
MERLSKTVIEDLIYRQKKTHYEISEILQKRFPNERGFSERSVRRFCNENNISKRSGVDEAELHRMVKDVVSKVGPTWGRKMITGYLRSRCVYAGERQVGQCLANVAPKFHEQRKNRAEQLKNPVPYNAEYFGHKLHIDQNEKLNMYGVVHVCAVDGYSGMIVSHALMPVKNNLLIYEHIYRQSILSYGMWDQLRTDHGREFALMLFIQDVLREHRTNVKRLPYIQSTSKKNHRIERMWVEMNLRVNYPVKRVLNSMVDDELLDINDDITKFAISWVAMRVCLVGCVQVIDAWNSHSVPGKGEPKQLQKSKDNTKTISPSQLPTTEEAVQMYEEQGGALTYWPEFGEDPLTTEELQQERENNFHKSFHNFDVIFHRLAIGESSLFQNAVILFRDLTIQFAEFEV